MKQPPPEKKPSTGILTLLEKGDGETSADSAAKKCMKISETIYRCLCDDSTCRYKFDYASLALCSWPRLDVPERTLSTLPCTDTNGDKQADGK